MSNNPEQPNSGRPMPPNYSQGSGSQPPYSQQPNQPGYGSQQPNGSAQPGQQYGSNPGASHGQQPYSQQPSQNPYGSQQPGGGQQPYGAASYGGVPNSAGMTSAFGPAAGVPIGAPLPDAAYGPGSVGFWQADQTERSTALWSHLAHGATYVVGLGWIVTLILFIMNKDKSPYLRHHGAQSLNLLIIGVIAGFSIGLIGGLLSIVGIGFLILLLLPLLSLYMIIIEIVAGLAANRGEGYRIPMTPNWIK